MSHVKRISKRKPKHSYSFQMFKRVKNTQSITAATPTGSILTSLTDTTAAAVTLGYSAFQRFLP